MSGLYATLEAATNAVDAMIGSLVADNPDLDGDDAAYEAVVAIAFASTSEVATELCRTQLGWVPSHLQMSGHVDARKVIG